MSISCASGDGSVLGVWKDQAFGGIFVVSFSANHLECSNRPQAAGYVCPDNVGERIYSGSGLLNSRGEQIDEEDPAGQRGIVAVPAIGGPYFLTVPPDNRSDCAAVQSHAGEKPPRRSTC